jgi:hypothetical protein
MEAQKLLDAAPYGPEILKVLKQALDEAWASIASTTAPDLVENTRLSLAHAIVAHACSGEPDCEKLKAVAIEAIRKHQPQPSASVREHWRSERTRAQNPIP